MIITILIFILILGVLVFSHEFGHFILAKRAGIRVDEFGFGLPPRLFGVKVGKTLYSLNLLPFGGFVKIYGEDGEGKEDSNSFSSKSVSVRAKIIAAGVIMNMIFAFFAFSVGHFIGLPTVINDDFSGNIKNPKVQITQIANNSPAELSNLKVGDEILRLNIDDKQFLIFKTGDLQNLVSQYKGRELTIAIKRGNENLEKKLTPRETYPPNEGPLGIGMVKTGIVSYPWHIAPIEGFKTTIMALWMIISAFFLAVKGLIINGKVGMDVAGPIGIAVLTSQALKLGFIYILQLAAFLSVNLALINAIPFPALDGGRLLFLAIEKIRGKRVPFSVEKLIHGIGFMLLILLIIVVTFRDIRKLF